MIINASYCMAKKCCVDLKLLKFLALVEKKSPIHQQHVIFI